jgi:carbamoyl-phosphate synthase large subunit
MLEWQTDGMSYRAVSDIDAAELAQFGELVNAFRGGLASLFELEDARRSALQARVTYYTTVAGARAACAGMQQMRELRAYSVQELHASLSRAHNRAAQLA